MGTHKTSERNCPKCKTPLYRRINFEPKSSDFWDDRLDKKLNEHTRDRCRWARTKQERDDLLDLVSQLKKSVEKK